MIPYFDNTRQYQILQKDYEKALLGVAESGQYVLGQTVENFERNFSKYCGSKFGIGIGSGTDALIYSLKALKIGPGDEVIVPSFTFMASVFSIMHVGATPVFADVNPDTYTIETNDIEKLITKKTRAILPVHLYGHPANMTILCAIARKKKLAIIEDACQAHGALWGGKKVGSFGNAGCFSFYPTKNLGAMGDGGMVVTDNPEIIDGIKKCRNLGRITLRDRAQELGWTSRLDAIQAAVLDVKLKRLDQFNDNRRRAAKRYIKNLSNSALILPTEAKDAKHVFHLFVVRVPNKMRDLLQAELAKAQISTLIHYPVPVHEEPICKAMLKKAPKLPVTNSLCEQILSLPMFPEIRDEEIDKVSSVILDFFKRNG